MSYDEPPINVEPPSDAYISMRSAWYMGLYSDLIPENVRSNAKDFTEHVFELAKRGEISEPEAIFIVAAALQYQYPETPSDSGQTYKSYAVIELVDEKLKASLTEGPLTSGSPLQSIKLVIPEPPRYSDVYGTLSPGAAPTPTTEKPPAPAYVCAPTTVPEPFPPHTKTPITGTEITPEAKADIAFPRDRPSPNLLALAAGAEPPSSQRGIPL